MAFERMKLGELLLKHKLISKEQLDTAMEYQRSLGGKIGNIIVKLGYINDEQLTHALARFHGMPITDLANQILPMNLLKAVPKSIIEKHQVIPVHVTDSVLTVAMSDPTDYEALDELQFATGKKIEVTLATRDSIRRAIIEFINALDTEQRKAGKPRSQGAIRPASKGALKTLKDAGEAQIAADFKERAEKGGMISTGNITRADLRSAVIPLLIKKGVISETELFDAVIELLKRKGTFSARELSDKAKESGGA